MGKAAKAQFIAEQKALDGEDWNYVIGGSSPWVDSYTIEERENAAMITYTMQDSQPAYYTMKELFEIRGGKRKNRCRRLSHLQFLLGGRQGAS